MGSRENALELERERRNNLVRAVEAAKSSRHSLILVTAYAPQAKLGPHVARALDAVAFIEDALRTEIAK